MKRFVCFALALCLGLGLFVGCGEEPVEPPKPISTPEPSPEPTPEPMPEPIAKAFAFSRENMPRMDGSTSLVPLAQAAASLLLGESREAVEDLVQFNRTSQSYRNLRSDFCDILIASVPSADVYEELDAEGFAYEMEPIATDALIFVVNEGNPVDSLTTEEIIGIYTGEITNWSEVGGLNEPIAAFQRNAGAGSQALMEKLVMGDIPMMTPPTELMAGSMGELMEYVKSYDNSAGAIGYSVYYYANDMRMAEGLKIIAVDGAEPTDENIRDGLYPHLSNYYTVIAADEAEDSPARIMFEWLQSAEGQRLVKSEGYVPVKTYEDFESSVTSGGFVVETHPETLSAVETQGTKYTRLSEERIEALVPRDDYGALHPFVGVMNYNEGGWANPVYGLFDSQSRIVCDPVYSTVERLCYWENGMTEYVPVLLLGRSVYDTGAEPKMVYTLASPDGSFVSPEYRYIQAYDFGVMCSETGFGDSFVIYDFDGNIIFRSSDLKLGGMKMEHVFEASGGHLLLCLDDGDGSDAYLISPEGDILCGGWESARFAGEDRLIVTGEGYSVALVDFAGREIIPTFNGSLTLNPDDSLLAHEMNGDIMQILDRDGKLVFEVSVNALRSPTGFIDGGTFRRCDGSSFAISGDWKATYYESGCPVIYKEEAGALTLLNTLSEKTFTLQTDPERGSPAVEQLMVNYVTGPYSSLPYLMVWDGNIEHGCQLISWDFKNRLWPEDANPGMGSYYTVPDGLTGEEYIVLYNKAFESYLISPELAVIAGPGQWTGVWNGLLVNTDDSFCTYTDMDGEVIFRYPLMINGD